MSELWDVNSITDAQVRDYLKQNLGEMALDAQNVLSEIQKQPTDARTRIHEEAELAFMPTRMIPDTKAIDIKKIKTAIKKGVWHLCCNITAGDPKKGEPDKTIADLFNKEGMGAEIIKAAIVAAFTAIGGVWAGLAAFLAGTLGKKLQDWIIGVVCSQLDAIIEKKLTKFCEIVPE